MHTLVYMDFRKVRFIKNHLRSTDNIILSKPGQEIIVNDEQMKFLLRLKNGTKPCFELKEGGQDNAGAWI